MGGWASSNRRTCAEHFHELNVTLVEVDGRKQELAEDGLREAPVRRRALAGK